VRPDMAVQHIAIGGRKAQGKRNRHDTHSSNIITPPL
jgi:hypothetical protein